jgi:uncharacterized protein
MKTLTLIVALMLSGCMSPPSSITPSQPTQPTLAASQDIYMDVTRNGFVPNIFTLKKGIPVKWHINPKEVTGCNDKIIIPSINAEIYIPKGIVTTYEFTPAQTGPIEWSCWMGMQKGRFDVT